MHILTPHQQPHSQILHHHLQQDGQVIALPRLSFPFLFLPIPKTTSPFLFLPFLTATFTPPSPAPAMGTQHIQTQRT